MWLAWGPDDSLHYMVAQNIQIGWSTRLWSMARFLIRLGWGSKPLGNLRTQPGILVGWQVRLLWKKFRIQRVNKTGRLANVYTKELPLQAHKSAVVSIARMGRLVVGMMIPVFFRWIPKYPPRANALWWWPIIRYQLRIALSWECPASRDGHMSLFAAHTGTKRLKAHSIKSRRISMLLLHSLQAIGFLLAESSDELMGRKIDLLGPTSDCSMVQINM